MNNDWRIFKAEYKVFYNATDAANYLATLSRLELFHTKIGYISCGNAGQRVYRRINNNNGSVSISTDKVTNPARSYISILSCQIFDIERKIFLFSGEQGSPRYLETSEQAEIICNGLLRINSSDWLFNNNYHYLYINNSTDTLNGNSIEEIVFYNPTQVDICTLRFSKNV